MLNFNHLRGKTLAKIDVVQHTAKDHIIFTTNDDERFKLYHEQGCCEIVGLEDITGDVNALLNSPILLAEEVSGETGNLYDGDAHFTWTFYKLRTHKADVTLRWYGESNGYYSETVDFVRIK